MKAYRAVLFDFDGTLRESEPHFMDALHHFLLESGIHIDSFQWRLTERWVHQYWAQSPELLADIAEYGGESIWDAFITRLMTHAGHPPRPDEVQAFGQRVEEMYHPVSRLVAGAHETLQALQQRDVMLAVLSNRRESFTEALQELGIASYFSFALAAGEIGAWKPDPAIFTHALARAGLQAGEVVYIGDNYYADVVGATEAGLDAILLDERRVFTDMRCPRVEALPDIVSYLDGYLPASKS